MPAMYEGSTIYRQILVDILYGKKYDALYISSDFRSLDDWLFGEDYYIIKTDDGTKTLTENDLKRYDIISDYYQMTGLPKVDSDRDFFVATHDYYYDIHSVEDLIIDVENNFDIWFDRASKLYSDI
jgi:hypothetical protein